MMTDYDEEPYMDSQESYLSFKKSKNTDGDPLDASFIVRRANTVCNSITSLEQAEMAYNYVKLMLEFYKVPRTSFAHTTGRRRMHEMKLKFLR